MSATDEKNGRAMVLIPCYREASTITDVVKRALHANGANIVVVVDDGSDDDTARLAEKAGAVVLKHEKNLGKGAALKTGFRYAIAHGYAPVVTIDGDGQHAPEEIGGLLDVFEKTGADLVIGTRMSDTENMPLVRRITNKVMSRIIGFFLDSANLSDTQSGFRAYGQKAMDICIDNCATPGFSAESESILQLSMRGAKFAESKIPTIYGDERSKIHPIRDTIRFFRMIFKFWSMKRRFLKEKSMTEKETQCRF